MSLSELVYDGARKVCQLGLAAVACKHLFTEQKMTHDFRHASLLTQIARVFGDHTNSELGVIATWGHIATKYWCDRQAAEHHNNPDMKEESTRDLVRNLLLHLGSEHPFLAASIAGGITVFVNPELLLGRVTNLTPGKED